MPVLVPNPKFVLYFIPTARIDPTLMLGPAEVRKIRPYFVPPDFLGTDPKIGADLDEWWSADPPSRRDERLPNPESEWCTRLFANGLFEVSQNIGHREEDDAVILLEGRRLESYMVGIADHLGEAYRELGHGGPGWLSVNLVEVQT